MDSGATQTTGLGKRTTRNSLYSMGVNVWYLLSRFLLTPVILHYLPLAEYGLWSLCFVVMSFLALSSMGLEATYVKYVAQFHAQKKTDAINRLLSTGLLVTTCFALLTLVVLWYSLPGLLALLTIPTELMGKAFFVFMGTGLIFMLDISLNCFARALDGYQYLALTAKIRFWSSLIELVMIVPLLMAGFGIYGLMSAFFIRYLIVIFVNIIYAYRLIPNLSLGVRYVDRSSLKILVSYGTRMQLLSIINILLSTIDRLIITSSLGLAATGLYEIGRKIPNKGARIPTEISGAIMPALSHLQGVQDMQGAKTLFLQGSRYMAMLSAPLFCFFGAIAPYAIFVWLGPGYEGSAPVMSIISLATIIHLFTGLSSALARGLNRLDWELKYSFLNLVLCLILTPLLANWFGLVGAALGVSIGIVCSSLYFLYTTHSFLQVSLIQYLRLVLTPLITAMVSAALLYMSLPLFVENFEGRGEMFCLLVLAGAGYFTLFALVMMISGYLTVEEKRWVTELFSRINLLSKIKLVKQRR